MRLYTDTELDSDIKYVKGIVSQCTGIYKNLEHDISIFNKTALSRIGFIMSQFGGIFPDSRS